VPGLEREEGSVSETAGRVLQLNLSGGGVPKLPVASAQLAAEGFVGDAQADRVHHGGPERAVCLWSVEVIEALRAEGHPVAPGSAGENVTVIGLDWSLVQPGARLRLGPRALVEITRFTTPCRKIAGAFLGGRFTRIEEKRHPGFSRVYARVLKEGLVREGDPVRLLAARAEGISPGSPHPAD
jgi:MOSC domain-containing protein YiiM